MALQPTELVTAAGTRPVQKRYWPTTIQPKTLASGTGTLDVLFPMAYNTSTNLWVPWSNTDGASQVSTITVNATGGTFTVTINGQTTAAVAWNATAAALQTALENLDNVLPGDLLVTGGPGGTTPYTITGAGRFAMTAFTISTTATSLTGGTATAAVATPTNAGAAVGISAIRAFVGPDPVVLNPLGEIQANLVMGGKVSYADIVLPPGETSTNLKNALRPSMQARGFVILDLDQVR